MTSFEHLTRCQKLRGGMTESEVLINADLAACERERDSAAAAERLVVGHGSSRALSAEEQREVMAHIMAKAVVLTNEQKDAIRAAERARLREGAVEKVERGICEALETDWSELTAWNNGKYTTLAQRIVTALLGDS